MPNKSNRRDNQQNPYIHSSRSKAFQQAPSSVGLDSIQRYENWRQRIINEHPVTHKGSPLRFITEDLDAFKAAIRSLLDLDDGTLELAITQLSIHNGVEKKDLIACYNQVKLESMGGGQ